MIDLNLTMNDVAKVDNTPLHVNLSDNATVVSDGKYIFAYDEPYYDHHDDWLVMANSEQVDVNGYLSYYPIPYFLGCNGGKATLDLQETTQVEGEQHYSLAVKRAIEAGII